MRLNSFSLIHKALRALLYDTALTLQQTDFADANEAEAALDKIEIVIDQFEKHAHHEDTFILPAVAVYDPVMVNDFEKEHVEDIELGNRLNRMLNIFRAAENDEARILCGSAINKTFRDFMVFNIKHMAKEEVEINNALWKHYTDDELADLTARLTAAIPPAEKLFTAKWMLRSVNKTEAIAFLKSTRQTAPDFVFEALYELAKKEVPKRFRAEVLDAVMERELAY